MSLLGAQVYANPDTPCWLSTQGGTVDGNVSAAVFEASSGYIAPQGGGKLGLVFQDASGSQQFRLACLGPASPRNIIQTNAPLYFNQIGTANGNTSLTVSAFGANADLLNVGGTLAAQRLSLTTGGAAPSCGSGAILVGQTNVVIPTTVVTANSIILVSHSGAAAAGPGNGAAQGGLTVNPALIVPGVSFRVDLVDPTTGIAVAASLVNAEFNYLIIN